MGREGKEERKKGRKERDYSFYNAVEISGIQA
jgi:hypothetical protein